MDGSSVIEWMVVSQSALGLCASLVILLDYLIHLQEFKLFNNHLHISARYNFLILESTASISFFSSSDYPFYSCLVQLYLIEAMNLSILLWTLLILQKCLLVTKYPIETALQYLSTNQFEIHLFIGWGFPLFTTSLLFVKQFQTGNCASRNLLESATDAYWAIQSTQAIVILVILVYTVVRIHLSQLENKRMVTYMLFSFGALFLSLPWLIYSGELPVSFKQLINSNVEAYGQIFYFLRNLVANASVFCVAANSASDESFLFLTITRLRANYLPQIDLKKKSKQIQVTAEMCEIQTSRSEDLREQFIDP